MVCCHSPINMFVFDPTNSNRVYTMERMRNSSKNLSHVDNLTRSLFTALSMVLTHSVSQFSQLISFHLTLRRATLNSFHVRTNSMSAGFNFVSKLKIQLKMIEQCALSSDYLP